MSKIFLSVLTLVLLTEVKVKGKTNSRISKNSMYGNALYFVIDNK